MLTIKVGSLLQRRISPSTIFRLNGIHGNHMGHSKECQKAEASLQRVQFCCRHARPFQGLEEFLKSFVHFEKKNTIPTNHCLWLRFTSPRNLLQPPAQIYVKKIISPIEIINSLQIVEQAVRWQSAFRLLEDKIQFLGNKGLAVHLAELKDKELLSTCFKSDFQQQD